MKEKQKFDRAAALDVARWLHKELQVLCCERLIFAGSLRRRKAQVGDIELLYIPRTMTVPDGLFDTAEVDLVDAWLEKALAQNLITKRLNENLSPTWGPKNKFIVHQASGIPVDFFKATKENWFNYLVCRTGPLENNIRIAEAARSKRWHWEPTGAGFEDEHGKLVKVERERDVYDFVGLPYKEPWER